MRNCTNCGEVAVLRVDSVMLNELEGRDSVGKFWLCRECSRVCEFCGAARYWEETHTPKNAHGAWCDLCRLTYDLDHVAFIELPYFQAEISKWQEGTVN